MAYRSTNDKNVWSWFLLSRPYSWINVVLIVLLAITLGKGTLMLNTDLILPIIMGLFFWNSCVFLLDFLHKGIDGRSYMFSDWFLIISLVVLILILIFTAPLALPIFLASFGTTLLYGSKAKQSKVSHFMFLFRPFTEIGIIYSVALMQNISVFSSNLFALSIIVYLISVSRNLIGDIRDTNHDKHTLPKVLGPNFTYLTSGIFLFALMLITGPTSQILPLLFILILIIFRANSFGLHKLYILCTTFYFALILLQYNTNPIFVLSLVFVGFILYNTYNLIPRQTNNIKPIWV